MMLTTLIFAATLTVQATPAPTPVPPVQPAAGPATNADWRTAGAERFGKIEFADPDQPAPEAEEPDPDVDEAANAFDWFGEAYGQGAVEADEPADCVTAEPTEGQRACTFDEALAESYRTQPSREAYQEQPPQPTRQSGCRREEYTNPDGSGGGVRVVCGSGDSRAIDALRQSLQPFPR